MCGAACPSADAVHILVAFRGVLCKVDPCSKHPPDVSVPLIKPFRNDGVWWRWPLEMRRKGNWSSCVKSRKLELHSLKEESDMEGKGSFIAWTFSNSTSDRSFISWLYRERACARCGGCGSRRRSPSACVRIAPSASVHHLLNLCQHSISAYRINKHSHY